MTADTPDFPTIEAPPPAVARAPTVPAVVAPPAAAVAVVAPSIKDAVLAQFKAVEPDLVAMAKKYRDVAYAVATTKGMAEAKAARADLRDNGRLAITKAEKAVKTDVNDLKRVMADEVTRLVAIVQPVEDAIDSQIRAEEERKAREKAERERIEAERVARHNAGIAQVRAYLAHCQQHGMTAERIGKGITMLEAVTFGPEWQEFAVPAAIAQCETLEAMCKLHAEAVEREAEALRLEVERQAEAERLEAERVEHARIAAEQAAERQRLEEAAAELARQQREAAENVARIGRLQARIAEIHAAATGHDGADAWTLFEAIVAIEALDVSAEQYQELAPLAQAAQAGTLATLRGLHAAAVAREDAARDARIAAEKAERDAHEVACAGTPAVCASNAADSAEAAPSGDEGPGGHAEVAPLVPAYALVATPEGDRGPEPELPPDPLDSDGGLTDIAPAAVDLLGDAIAPVAVDPVDAAEALARCREALTDALELLEGWILTKCPRKHIPEHMAHVAKLRDMGGLPRSVS